MKSTTPDPSPDPSRPPASAPDSRDAAARAKRLLRFLPLAVLSLLLALFFATGLHRQVGFATLKQYRGALLAEVEAAPVLAALGFVVTYVVTVAASLPIATVLSVTGGFLFGTWGGGLLNITAATLGSGLLFLAARTALGDWLARRVGRFGRTLSGELQANPFSYILVLRLVPLFPFWVVNLVPALAGVPLRAFAAGTALGVAPGAFVFAGLGAGLGLVFDRGDTPDLGLLASPTVLGPLLGLAALAALPILYRRFKRR